MAVGLLTAVHEGQSVIISGHAQTICAVGKNMVFLVLRQSSCTVQCVVIVQPDAVSHHMVRHVAGLSCESMVDVHGIVIVPSIPIKGAAQQFRMMALYDQFCMILCHACMLSTFLLTDFPVNLDQNFYCQILKSIF